MKKLLFASTFLLMVQFAGANKAQAQPDINNAPKGENPPNRDVRARKPKLGTAEQIAKRRAKRLASRADDIRSQLVAAGFTDEALLNTIVDYYKSEQEARAKISDLYHKVLTAQKSKNTPDAELVPLLADLRTAIAEEKIRQEKSFLEFSTKLKLDQNPRLDAMLMVRGVTGSERAFASQADGLDTQVNTAGALADVEIKINGQ